MTVFYKYQAAGNDFIIIDSTEAYSHGKGEQYLSEWQACATRICHRRFGVGADGILLVSRLMGDNFDIKVDIINSDGSLAEMCGNGMRCVARYLSDILSVSTGAWRVETLGGIQFIRLQASCEFPIEVRMARVELGDELEVEVSDGRKFTGTSVSVGNPHFVICVDASEDVHALAGRYGEELCKLEIFREGANIEFTKLTSVDEAETAVYERGCGITMACGTGAVATSGVWHKRYGMNEMIIAMTGGRLKIQTANESRSKYILCGDASKVFEGTV